MVVSYKFSIGDKVLLKKVPSRYQAFGSFGKDYVPTEYEINGLAWTLDEQGLHSYYRLDAYLDKWLCYHNQVEESVLEPVGESNSHEENFELVDINGEVLKIGDNIVEHAYKNCYKKLEINTRFSFVGEGTIQKFEYFEDGTKMIDGSYVICKSYIKVVYERHFNCTFKNGNDMLHACRYGNISSCDNIKTCFKRLPDNYVNEYVNACIKQKFNPLNADEHEYWDVWLKHLGVYEEVKKLYNEYLSTIKVNTKPKKIKDTKKINDIVNNLTEEEKEELRKLLKK